jgi:CMP-N-acetylneuraminic acid synthetase
MKDICGKPMIWYTLDLMSKLGHEAYLYTDNEELREYAKCVPGINIKIKPDIYSQDKHLTNIELMEYNKEIKADVFVYLAATSPIRLVETIKLAISKFINNMDKFDCAMAVRELPDRMYWYGYSPCSFELKHRTFNNSDTIRKKIFEETGSLYIFKKELLQDNFFINNKCLYVNDDINIDIDTFEDLERITDGKKTETTERKTAQKLLVENLKEIENWYQAKYNKPMPVINYSIMKEFKESKHG